AV
ncbi:putative transcriptional regulator, partial [Gloeomargarita lithophora Alchichica-D10]